MALEDIIAQRIAAMSAARMRLNENISSLGPINEGLEALRQARTRKDAMALQTRGLDLQERGLAQREAEFEAEQVGVPEALARPVAESFVPKPTPISGGDLPAPYSAPAVFGNVAQTAIRRGKIDAITSALGARGGANLMAKLAAYSALNKAQQAEAAERLKMTTLMATAAGGPKAFRPEMDPEMAARGASMYAAGQTGAGKDEDAAAEDAWWQTWGPQATSDPSKLPPEAVKTMPARLRINIGSRAGQEERFETGLAFRREQEARAVEAAQQARVRADAFLKLGQDREARLVLSDAREAARGAVASFERENGAKKTEIDPAGGIIERYRVDENTLAPDRKLVWRALVTERDTLDARVKALAPAAAGDLATLTDEDLASQFESEKDPARKAAIEAEARRRRAGK